MEGGSLDGEKKPSGSGEPKVKRKMKTPSQIEVLEKTYQVETYPSESLRAELSSQLGLTDRQLQMWFCHRRLKDRKPETGSNKRSKKKDVLPTATAGTAGGTPPRVPPPVVSKDDMMGVEMGNEHGSGSGSGSSPYGRMEARRGGYGTHTGVAVPRISGHKRYYERPSQSVADLRAIAFVEAQLGEPLREDGPALGLEFDPLPPGAFGAPIATPAVPHKAGGRDYDASMYERPDAKSSKGSKRAVHEYQFLPEQPTVRNDAYERVAQPHYFGSPSDVPGSKTPPMAGGRSYMHGYEEVPAAYDASGQPPSLSLMGQQGKSGGKPPYPSGDYDNTARKSPYVNVGVESPYSAHPITGHDNAVMPSERQVSQEEEIVRVERKRKSDEARIAKELEAHEKRIRKELEKQDILRRKREEQIRKEMERQDRERRKEEERLLREKLREEERYQREQRREMERREKFLLKESIRAEKMKQKEEHRREREAARQKAANDRAAARRLAKESMELIEDERLELMEIAASRKGLPSIVSLDSETLQNLDSFRDMLRVFPPKSVQLKKPFAIQPWMGSEENVGNLLMVWRFLITFADVLGLWPFTLDEFVQALHDYDPRLLGEIHVALLKTIIKDIEDVARTPSSGLGANQHSAANPGGGHPQIVEGAYAWGFDIRSWQRNLGPMTWPEILRQFALSSGLGPKLRKRNVDHAYSRDDNEGTDGINIISNLRNGAAAENAVAIMRERGYSNPRRSRHRLTPGTVKFAAFHVLSLEGSKGLNILEVADRIQKSGLRDLTTSKTPEASIAAALSRDTKLFERTAPSTYCVRSPYRKDPTDADEILSTAREKIRAFKSGLEDGVEEADADGVEADDVEKDEDSESDTAEDLDVDDLGTGLTPPNKDIDSIYDVNKCEPKTNSGDGIENLHAMAIDNTSNGVGVDGISVVVDMGALKGLDDNGCSVEEAADAGIFNEGTNAEPEGTDIDESCSGEPWIQGLVEAEYACLSVEERINALVSLIGVATEGNSVRLALEERLESATALKKQLWAEAQVDKRRFKEEYMMKTPYAMFPHTKNEANMLTPASDSKRSPMLAPDENNNGTMNHQNLFNDPNNDGAINADQKNQVNCELFAGSDNHAMQQSVYAAERSRAQLKSYIGHKAEEMYVYRSLPLGQDRRRNRYWQFIASSSCNDPGAGRIFVELQTGGWKLIDSEEAFDALLASLDVRGVRESHLHALLQKVEPLFKQCLRMKEVESNRISVKPEASEMPPNTECAAATDSPSSSVCAFNLDSPETSTSFRIEAGKSSNEMKNMMKRHKNFEDWMWNECLSTSILCATKFGKKRCTQLVDLCDSCHDLYYFEENHCSCCHKTFSAFDGNGFNFSDHVTQCKESKLNHQMNQFSKDYPPPRIRLLKVLLARVEVCIPHEALLPVWSEEYRNSWGRKLYMSSSVEQIFQVLTLFEGAVKRDFISSTFQTTSELLACGNGIGNGIDASDFGMVNVLPWIPQTTSAVALRLMELDSAISYLPEQKLEKNGKDAEAQHFIHKFPSKYAVVRNIQEDEFGEHQDEDGWADQGGNEHVGYASIRGGGGRGRGRGGSRTRGGRSQRSRGVVGSRPESSNRRNLATNDGLGQGIGGWRGRSSTRGKAKGGRKRGRRSVRSRQKPVKKAATAAPPTAPTVPSGRTLPNPATIIFEKSPPGFSGRDEWNNEPHRGMQVEEEEEVDVNDDSHSEYDDDNNGQVSGEEYDMAIDDDDDDDYPPVYNNSKPTHVMEEGSDYNVDEDEEEEEEDDHDHGHGVVVGDDDDMDEVVGEDDDMYEEEAGYEQGNLDVGGFFNVDSEEEEDEGGNNGDDNDNVVRRGGGGQDEDTSDSASTDYSSDE